MWRTKVVLASAPTRVRIGGSIPVGAPSSPTIPALIPAAPPEVSAAASSIAPPAAPVAVPADAQLLQLLDGISQKLTELESRRRESLSVLQQAVVELSVAIASQLTYRIIESGEFAVEKMVEDAVSRLPAAEHVTLRLHSDDLALFQQRIKAIPAASLDARSLHLVADPAVARGGCLAELPDQGILCDIELLLGDLHTELMEGLSDAQVERRRAQGTDRSLRRFPDRRETA